MKNHFKLFNESKVNNRVVFFMFLFSMLSTTIFGQVKTVSGIITDEFGSPLPGVSVAETGTLNGVSTDFDGIYSIKVKVGSSLTFAYLGYKSVVKGIGKEDIINIKLIPDVENLNEIVVIGYGSVKKKDLTGSVAIVPLIEYLH